MAQTLLAGDLDRSIGQNSGEKKKAFLNLLLILKTDKVQCMCIFSFKFNSSGES